MRRDPLFDHKVLEGFRWLKDVPSMKLVEIPMRQRFSAQSKS
ncbi:hypothetical protein PO124_11395 [Bacillus licheniformis]|nr:hypothetical protein [Bacillus licheniformis]